MRLRIFQIALGERQDGEGNWAMMAKVAIGFGILVIIAVSGVSGAGVYRWLVDEPEAAVLGDFYQGRTLEEVGILDDPTVKKLVFAHIASNVTLARACLSSGLNLEAGIYLTYNQVTWVVKNGLCAFYVDDRTGKVTGP